MRILSLVLTTMFFLTSGVWAETLNLKDGHSVAGTISKRDAKKVEINVDGVTMTYYADEIKDIDGAPFTVAVEPAVTKPVAAKPEAAKPADEAVKAPEAKISEAPETGEAKTPEAPATAEAPAKPEVSKDQTVPAETPVTDEESSSTATLPAKSVTPSATSVTPPPLPPAATPPAAVEPPAAEASAPPAVPEAFDVSNTSGVSPEKRALILKFIEVFGTRQALNNNFELMLKQIEKEKPEEAKKIHDRVKVDEIIERLMPVYDRNFTTEDLDAFIAFYSSPQGQKLIKTIPILMKESVQESVKYMEEKFPESKMAAAK